MATSLSFLAPQTASADNPTSCPSGDFLAGNPNELGPACVTLININVSVASSNADLTSLSGYRVTRNVTTNANTSGSYSLTNPSGNNLSVIPSALSVTITDTSTGAALPTFYYDSSNDIDYSNSKGLSGPPTISGNFLQYQVFGSAFAGDTYKICAEGQNVPQQCITDPLNNGATHSSNSLPLVTSKSIQTGVTIPLPAGSNGAPDTSKNPSATATIQSAAAGGSTTASCESSPGGFGWLFCEAGHYMASAENSIEGYVNGLLKTQSFNFSCTSTSQSCATANADNGYSAKVYTVWSNFRLYGDIVLVIALLVIVFGEALGGGVIDAYTAKKMLPRILAAAILINLSIYIVVALEDVVNVVGGGIATLIETPFKTGLQPGTFSIKIAGGTGNLLALITATGAVYAGITLGGIGILVAIIGLGLIAAIGVLITIMLRQIIIVLLLIFAPIAFALYCLPNTEQYFKKWWSLLIKTLMVYPIVAVIFAASQIGGVIMSNFNITATGNVIAQSMAFLADIIPLFLIPFAFKMSGGVIGNIAGMVSNFSSRARAPIKNALKKRATDRFTRAQNQSLWSNSTGKGKFGNKIATWATAPGQNFSYFGHKHGFGGASGARVAASLHHKQMEQTMEEFKEMQGIAGFNDKAGRAVSGQFGGWNKEEGKYFGFNKETRAALVNEGLASYGDYVRDENGNVVTDAQGEDVREFHGRAPRSGAELGKIADILSKSSTATEVEAAGALRAFRPRFESMFLDPERDKANTAAAGLMLTASHGFAEAEDLASYYNHEAEEEPDFAYSAVTQAQVMASQQRPDLKKGYGVVYNREANGKTTASGVFDQGNEARAEALVGTLDTQAWSRAKQGTIGRLLPTMNRMLHSGDQAKVQAVKDSLFQGAGAWSSASNDVKATVLNFLDKESGGRQARIESMVKRDAAGQPIKLKDAQGRTIDGQYEMEDRPVYGYAPGTIGYEFEQTLRTGRSPDEVNAMLRMGVDPDQATGTQPGNAPGP